MRLKFVCDLGDVREKTWSGSTQAVFDRLSKLNHECVPAFYSVRNIKSKWFVYIENIIKRLFFYWDKNVVGYDKEWEEFLSKELEDADGMFFFSNFIVGSTGFPGKKFYSYIDCELNYEQNYLRRKYLPFRKSFMKRYNKNVQRALDNTAKVFTMNEWTARELIIHYNYPKDKVINVGFGVNCKFLSEGKDYDQNLLLIVLRKGTERYKGLLLLLEAFKLVRQVNKDVKLAVVGTDVGADIDGVECYYNKPRELTLELFKKATLYVMPSLCEPNGITYLEALANKTPIIGLNRFAIPEFTGNGKYGFIVDKPEAETLAKIILEALSDKSRLKTMGEEGQAFVRGRYNWDNVCQKIKENL